VPIKLVKVEDAVGKVLAYDVSAVTKDFKGALFRKGHVVRVEDVEALKNTGHYYVYVADTTDELARGWGTDVFEDDAVRELAEALAGSGTSVKGLAEGKATIYASVDGVLKLRTDALLAINMSGDFIVTARREDTPVKRGEPLAVVDLIPLTVKRAVLDGVKDYARRNYPVVSVKPYQPFRVGLAVIGTEVYEGRIKDAATPVIEAKVRQYGGTLVAREVLPDDEGVIASKLREYVGSDNVEVIIATGGMSVDPTDRTPHAIRAVADEVIAYGVPYKPNTMTMVAYAENKPVIGVPSSIIFFHEKNILDILLPKIAAREKITREYLASLGNGGLTEEFIRRKLEART